MNQIFCTRIAHSFSYKTIRETLLSKGFEMEKEGDVLVITTSSGKLLFLFPFGTVVFWDFSTEEQETFIEIIRSSFIGKISEKYECFDEFSTEKSDFFSVENDMIGIPEKFKIPEKLALSYAVAQSTAILFLEYKVEEIENLTQNLPKELAKHGKTNISGKKIRKIIGSVLQKKHEINLDSSLSTTPDHFWEFPETENLYQKINRYLEISQRTAQMNRKIGVIQDTLDVLRDESNVRHSAFLEWIIIWLIVIEVIFTLWEHFGHFLFSEKLL